ncbi:MAG: 30S ribosome-binding factor RbfA [Gemmatimonadales bacterium]|nr:MAG: 30S ribosome-binding factor RbfA [Gemmatimonadales bacterium]
MAGKRIARLNEQFRREITSILRTQVRDPRVGVPTVTGVEVTPDLWMARIHVRPDPSIESETAAEDLMQGLMAAAAYIRRELSGTLTVRRVPELRFQIDRSVEHAARIHALLAEVLPHESRDYDDADADDDDAGDADDNGADDNGADDAGADDAGDEIGDETSDEASDEAEESRPGASGGEQGP